MKYYLFLTSLIRNIGGGHIYTRNKINFLQDKGFRVGFFHADIQHGEIVIQDLLNYKNNCDNHLQYPTYFFSKKIQKEVVTSICNRIPDDHTEIIIESQTVICATWGELIAKRVNAKHFIFLLSEHHYLRNKNVFNFFKFKLDRKELVGIEKKSLSLLFDGWYNISEMESYFLTAHCTNVLEDISYPKLSQISQSDYTIGSIGRIDKLFMVETMKQVAEFVKLHPHKSFTLLLIGGSTNKNAGEVIKSLFKSTNNVKVFITGLIYPVPVELVLIPDVFVSTAGSCIVSNSVGKLTISIDNNDFKPIGIYGKTTDNILFRSNEPDVSLNELLDSILIRRMFKSKISYRKKDLPLNYDYSDHLEFVRRSDILKEYFDISKAKLSFIDWIEKIGLVLFGRALYPKVIRLFSPIWIKIKRN